MTHRLVSRARIDPSGITRDAATRLRIDTPLRPVVHAYRLTDFLTPWCIDKRLPEVLLSRECAVATNRLVCRNISRPDIPVLFRGRPRWNLCGGSPEREERDEGKSNIRLCANSPYFFRFNVLTTRCEFTALFTALSNRIFCIHFYFYFLNWIVGKLSKEGFKRSSSNVAKRIS